MGFFSSRKKADTNPQLKVIHPRLPHATTAVPAPAPPSRHLSTDALTMSLAQKLDDLAMANADGLLGDEEHRLLRQNIFERYTAVDPVSSPRPRPLRSEPHPSQNKISRAPSIISQRSISSTFSSLFRRATGRDSDSISFFSSSHQPAPPSPPPTLSRHPSDDSLMTTSQAGSSSVTHDMRSVISRRHRMPYASSGSSRTTSRSAKPPSSFRLPSHAHTSTTPSPPPHFLTRTHEGDQDDDTIPPKSAADLRAEIATVEAECCKLLDAFSGLELTVLTKSRTSMMGVGVGSRLGSLPEGPAEGVAGFTLVNGDRAASTVPLVAQPVNLKRKASVVAAITDPFKSMSERATTMGLLGSSSSSSHASSTTTTAMSTSTTHAPPSSATSIISTTTSGRFLSSSPPLHSSRSSPNLLSHHPSGVTATALGPMAAASSSLGGGRGLPALPISTPPKKRPSLLRPSRKQPQPPPLPPFLMGHRAAAASATADPAVSNRPVSGTGTAHPLGLASTTTKASEPPKPPDDGGNASHATNIKHPVSSPLHITKPSSTHPSTPTSHPSSSAAAADPVLAALETELNEIRRKRAEVAMRYKNRLEFLRAKLKTAEIRETLDRGRGRGGR